MGALYKLQAKAWFANIFNKMDFIMTFLFLMVLGSFVSFKAGDATYNDLTLSRMNITMISSIVLLMVASSAINTFGVSFFEMKESVLLKRIGATNISKFEAVVSFILWGMTSMLFIILWMMLIVGFCQFVFFAELTGGLLYVDPTLWLNVNWVGVIVAIIMTMVSFYAIAFFFVSISKNASSYQITGTFYFFLISFLGGAYTPNADVLWMDVISFLSPLGWGRELMSASMNGAQVFNFVDGYQIDSILDITETPFASYDEMVEGITSKTWNDLATMVPSLEFSPEFLAEYGVDNVSLDFATNMAAPYYTETINSFKAIGNILMPIIYGTLAAGFASKFFKWD